LIWIGLNRAGFEVSPRLWAVLIAAASWRTLFSTVLGDRIVSIGLPAVETRGLLHKAADEELKEAARSRSGQPVDRRARHADGR